jgi:hypothetical protein
VAALRYTRSRAAPSRSRSTAREATIDVSSSR